MSLNFKNLLISTGMVCTALVNSASAAVVITGDWDPAWGSGNFTSGPNSLWFSGSANFLVPNCFLGQGGGSHPNPNGAAPCGGPQNMTVLSATGQLFNSTGGVPFGPALESFAFGPTFGPAAITSFRLSGANLVGVTTFPAWSGALAGTDLFDYQTAGYDFSLQFDEVLGARMKATLNLYGMGLGLTDCKPPFRSQLRQTARVRVTSMSAMADLPVECISDWAAMRFHVVPEPSVLALLAAALTARLLLRRRFRQNWIRKPELA